MPSLRSADTSNTSANAAFAETSATKGSSRSRGRARSILLTSRIIGRPACSSRSSARLILRRESQCLDHEDVHVRIHERGERSAIHAAVDRATLVVVQAWQVHEDDLQPRAREHAVDAIASRLRLRADDGELPAQQRVEQRRLADVWPADERREATAACRIRSRSGRLRAAQVASPPRTSSSRCAASCSARRRLDPSPRVRSPSAATSQATEKCCSWGSPLTLSTV